MQSKVSIQLSDFLTFSRNIQSDHEIAFQEVKKCDKETQDILHQIELGNSKERNKFATQLAKVRRKRRIAKDVVDVSSDLVEFMHSKEFITTYRRLEQLLGEVRKKEQYVENHRKYNPRVCNNLTIDLMEDT